MTDIPFRKRTWSDRADQPKRPDLSGRVSLQGLRRLPMRLGRRVSSGHVLISASLNRQTGPLRSSRKDPSPFPLQQQEDCTGFSRKKFPWRTARNSGFPGMAGRWAGRPLRISSGAQRQLHSVPWRREGRRMACLSISRRSSARRPASRGGSLLPSPLAKLRKSVMPTPLSASV